MSSILTTAVDASAPRPWKPHAYQLKGVRWLLSHAGAGLFLDPGLGKTSITLAALKVLKGEGMLRGGALVVSPLRPLYNVWDPAGEESEPRLWTDFHGLKFSLLHGPRKEEALRRRADVYLVNPEGLPWLFGRLGRKRFDVLVVDESTVFKHSNTQRFRLLRGWLPSFARRWILTGSPSPNGLLDLFGQIYICDLGNALGRYITHYRLSYFEPTGFGGHTWVIQGNTDAERARTEQRIYRRVEPLVLRMSEGDYLKLPKLHGALAHDGAPSLVRVDLPAKAEAKYRELEELFFAELDGGTVTAANAGVKSMKLRQAANGGVYLDREVGPDGEPPTGRRRWAHLHDAKTDAVVELLDDLDGRSSVIAVEFHHDAERLRMHRRLRNVPAIGEGTVREDRLLAQGWNRGEIQDIIVNPASFARGSNMQRGGDALIFHSMIWNFEHYDQLIRRFWRQGRTRPFYVHHVVANGTSDMALVRALGRKSRVQRGLLDALREYSLRRPRRRP